MLPSISITDPVEAAIRSHASFSLLTINMEDIYEPTISKREFMLASLKADEKMSYVSLSGIQAGSIKEER